MLRVVGIGSDYWNVGSLRAGINLNSIQRLDTYRAVNKQRLGYKNQSVNVV